MKLLFLLVGMVLILEGLPYVAAPQAMRNWLAKLSEMPAGQLRVMGGIAMILGFLICFVVQKSGLLG
jgi:uncharacterized protein